MRGEKMAAAVFAWKDRKTCNLYDLAEIQIKFLADIR
jgi:hypothetical protein